MDENWALYLGIPVLVSSDPPTIYALDGCILSKILHATAPVSLTISGNHPETISFYFLFPLAPIILEHPCLTWHNPQFNLVEGTILSWGLSCKESCLGCACCVFCFCVSGRAWWFVRCPRGVLWSASGVQSFTAASPTYWPYDCRIDLVPGSMPPCGRLYSLSFPERDVRKIPSRLACRGCHCPLHLSPRAGFFLWT